MRYGEDMAIQTPDGLKLTYEDYVGFPDDGCRHEVIDGAHHMNPAPVPDHQRVSGRLLFQLMEQIQQQGHGEVFHAPIDLQLADTDVVQPDLVVLLTPRLRFVTPIKIDGPPDLVIEILSPSTAKTDRTLKKELYRRSGVPEYWIVDQRERLLEQWLLREEAYALEGAHSERVSFQELAGVSIDLTKVW